MYLVMINMLDLVLDLSFDHLWIWAVDPLLPALWVKAKCQPSMRSSNVYKIFELVETTWLYFTGLFRKSLKSSHSLEAQIEWRYNQDNIPWPIMLHIKWFYMKYYLESLCEELINYIVSFIKVSLLWQIINWLFFWQDSLINTIMAIYHVWSSVLPTLRFTRLIGILWIHLPQVKKLLGGWLEIGLLFICLPMTAVVSSNLTVSC